MRVVALAWLLAGAPIELATALAGLLRPGAVPSLGAGALVLIVSRILVVTTGLVLGRQLLQRQAGLRPLAWRWAAADLATLAIVLASARLPSNRAPGDAPLVWLAYATAAAFVIVAVAPASDSHAPAPDGVD